MRLNFYSSVYVNVKCQRGFTATAATRGEWSRITAAYIVVVVVDVIIFTIIRTENDYLRRMQHVTKTNDRKKKKKRYFFFSLVASSKVDCTTRGGRETHRVYNIDTTRAVSTSPAMRFPSRTVRKSEVVSGFVACCCCRRTCCTRHVDFRANNSIVASPAFEYRRRWLFARTLTVEAFSGAVSTIGTTSRAGWNNKKIEFFPISQSEEERLQSSDSRTAVRTASFSRVSNVNVRNFKNTISISVLKK